MNARGQAGGTVVFWDKQVLELLEMKVGQCCVVLEIVRATLCGCFQVFMDLFSPRIGKIFGLSWMLLEVFVGILGVLGEILMWYDFQQKGGVV